jgi:ACDE family multidrug resistance protein
MANFMKGRVEISMVIMAGFCLVAAGLTFVAVKPDKSRAEASSSA